MNNYFGDEEQQPTMSIKQVRNAAKLCDVCPVFTQCLRWSLEMREEYGVWAGTSGRVRRRIFTLLDNDETTVDDVIEVFLNGGGERFRSDAAYQASVRRESGAEDRDEARWCTWDPEEALGGRDRGLAGSDGLQAASGG